MYQAQFNFDLYTPTTLINEFTVLLTNNVLAVFCKYKTFFSETAFFA